MKLIRLQCPGCNAEMSVSPDDRQTLFCSHCGTKLQVKDDLHQSYTYREVNDSEIAEAQSRRDVQLKELELAQKQLEVFARQRRLFLFLWFGWMIVLLAVIVLCNVWDKYHFSDLTVTCEAFLFFSLIVGCVVLLRKPRVNRQ